MTRTVVAFVIASLIPGIALGSSQDDTVKEIIKRCREQMEPYGASLVKHCVDQDISALKALAGYDLDKYPAIFQRYSNQMLSIGGWTIVKFCIDEDINAERALEKY